jgi:hypothetical protein
LTVDGSYKRHHGGCASAVDDAVLDGLRMLFER